jgi:hypothetical protein
MSSASDAADRRGAKRTRAIQKGTIIFDGGNCVQPCAILDISETGARLRPLDSVICPDRFQLRDHKSKLHECTVVWRHGTGMGVKFD